jgi:hypothetical protein
MPTHRERRRSSGRVIVTLATAWGPTSGGLNVFNCEVVKSLGIIPMRDFELICVVPGHVPQELRDELRSRFHVEILSLESEENAFSDRSAPQIVERLNAVHAPHRFLWIGHDDKSGPLALELRSLTPGSHAIAINHMAHGAYQAVKKGTSHAAEEKRRVQLNLFRQVDLCLTIGPMLHAHLRDMLACEPEHPPVEMLVPGLSGPAPISWTG